jgi:protein phosphatase
MGTTCVVLAYCGGQAFIGHIGDSRAYLITRDGIRQLTEDHTTVAELQRRGLLTPQQARYHPERSMLYRALGVDPVADIDLQPPMAVRAGQWYLLCTDGLTTMVEDAEIAGIVVSSPPGEACRELIRRAKALGGFDNTTLIVIQVTDPVGSGRTPSTG